MASREFIWNEWLCHSNYSFLMGASYPNQFVERASHLGYKGLGLCDYNGVYGSVQAHGAIKSLRDKGLPAPRLMHGIEFSLRVESETPLSLQETLVLMAQHQEGYRNLCSLASEAHKSGGKKPSLALEALASAPLKGLIALQPMRGLIRHAAPEATLSRYRFYKDVFGSNLHLLLSRHLNPIEDRWIRPTLALAKRLDIRTLFSQDAYFHQGEEKPIHDLIQAIRLNRPLTDIMPHLLVNEERCLRDLATLEQRYRAFAEWETTLAYGQDLAESFVFSLSDLKYHYPKEFIPEQFTPYSYLEHILEKQLWDRYPQGLPFKARSLLQKELWIVFEMGLADYFLTVWDIVAWARRQQILCQGRGSAANSIICYILGITSLDPTTNDVLFERFLSRERGEPPDIDIDFEHERREEVIQYVYERYGRKRAAMVANVICFRGKSAFRSVGKALGVPEVWVKQVGDFRRTHSRAEALPPLPDEIEEGIRPFCSWELWMQMSQRIKGFPRHLGLHSGGFVLSDVDIDALCAQEPATMEGRTVLQWSKDDIETLEIYKIDLLALGMLSALRKAFHTIRDHYGETIEMYRLPPCDPKTFAMIQRADTVGTFQIESRAQMAMLPRLLPSTFYELAVQIGIIRPGPIQGGLIHPYIRRKQGLEPISYPDERLIPILKRTLGVPIFQEQIMRTAMIVGGFTADEADQLRKKIGAWSLGKDLDAITHNLRNGMVRNGVLPEFAEQVIQYLSGFSEYGFPESHSISFALIAYASSYVKCHYPLAFYMSLINSQPMGFYSVHALVQSARREGIGLLPPDINRSAWDSSVEYHPSGERFIRLGFHLVRGLSKAAADDLIELRQRYPDGAWPDFRAFLEDGRHIARKDLGALAAANTLQNFGIGRREAVWLMETFPRADLLETEQPYAFDQESEIERMEKDFESFASTLDRHPVLLVQQYAWPYTIKPRQLTSSKRLLELRNGATVHAFGMVLIRQSPPTANGILFVTLEDVEGFINLVCKPKIISQYRSALWNDGFLCVRGQLQRDMDSLSILVEEVYAPMSAVRALHGDDEDERSFEHMPPVRNFR